MNKDFNKAKVPVPNKSRHNLGNTFVGSMSWGRLTPIYTKEVAPGEVVNYRPHILVQTPPFASLTFAGIKVKQFSFFVPKRLLWDDFTDFIVGGSDGRQLYTQPRTQFKQLLYACGFELSNGDGTKFHSYLPLNFKTYFNSHRDELLQWRGTFSQLITSFGLNPYPQDIDNSSAINTSVQDKPISLLPFRAYQKIWWDWFRDSTLVPESLKSNYIYKDGGTKRFIPSSSTDYPLVNTSELWYTLHSRYIAYEKDYFTSSRLSPQQGLPSLVNPLQNGTSLFFNEINALDGEFTNLTSNSFDRVTALDGDISVDTVNGGFSVESLRLANSLQRFLERNNILGTRQLAQLLGRFGVAPSAARLDMAEYVGSTERRLNPQMVVSQSATDNADLAERAAFGQLFFDSDTQKYIAKEHGIFISLLCIVPEVEYCDGIERMWTMDTKEDYFQPEFENLGFEAIYHYELEAPTYSEVPVDGNKVFGFVPRYSWMKWKRGVLAGDFVRTDTNVGADTWHSFRRFTGKVQTSLNPKFVEVHPNDDNNNWDRLFVVTNNLIDPFKVNVWNENDAILPMEGTLTPALDAIYELDGKRIHVPYGGVRL